MFHRQAYTYLQIIALTVRKMIKWSRRTIGRAGTKGVRSLYPRYPWLAVKMADLIPGFKGSHSAQELRRLALKGPVTFAQIGANDGKTDNRLFPYIKKFGWIGIFIEPVPYLFEQLVANMQDFSSIRCVQAAVSSKAESREFFFLRQPRGDEVLPYWYNQLGSFHREVILKFAEFIPTLPDYLTSMMIECRTFGEILKSENFDTIDLLVVDAEGADGDIIRSIDFSKINPRVVIFEYCNLAPDDHLAARKRLEEFGYMLANDSIDIVAVKSPDWESTRQINPFSFGQIVRTGHGN